MKKLFALAMTLLLAACGGEEQTNFFDWERANLIYSYPADGQSAVPLHAPMVLRFSDAITGTDPLAELSLETAAGTAVPFSAELSGDGRSIVLTPDAPMTAATDYILDTGDQDTEAGVAGFPEDGVRFTTRLDSDGIGEAARTDTVFRVERMIPDGVEMPLMDFSSLRLQFTQPIDQSTLDYGSTVALRDDSGLVQASVIASGPYLTIDPVSDLMPGVAYSLELDSGLESTLGNNLAAGDYADMSIVPEDAGEGAVLVQKAGVSNDQPADQCGPDRSGDRLSPLTAAPINCVPITSLLLGDKTSSQQEGDVHAELASLNRYPDMTPLRIPRGSLLQGASVDVNVAGEVPVKFASGDAGTGEISVRFVSDANGYMFRNPYTDDAEAPRHIRLFMDVAMNTGNTEANAGLSQDLLHLELVGTAIIVDGRMTIDAVGVVEPEVLGLETAAGTLSFHMESYEDQENAPPPAADMTLPSVQSWVPDSEADRMRPGQPIIVNFNEPVARESLAQAGAVTLEKNGAPEPFSWRLDGSSLVITPDAGLEFSSEGATTTYNVSLTSAVTDLAGNMLDQNYDLSFDMPVYVGSGDRAPIALVTYPGYPCAFDAGTWDLANDDHGRCRFGEAGDDSLPVMPMPADRSIRMEFSQSMRADSFVLGQACGQGTFRVERVDNSGGCIEPVPGRLEVNDRSIVFTPNEPWQDGVLYGYRVMSATSIAPADCGVSSVCSSYDYPLQTAVLDGRDPDQGGPDMRLFFRGAQPVDHVFQTLDNLPTLDTNANYFHESAEPDPLPDPDNPGQYLTSPNSTRLQVEGTGGLLLEANLGCGFEGPTVIPFWEPNPAPLVCNDRKFIHLIGALNADVVGWDESEGAVRVKVYPTTIMTTSLDTWAILSLIVAKEKKLIPTGPQIMRIRYQDDGSGNRTEPVTGWIRETPDGPVLDIELDVYLSAPDLEPEALGLTLTHDLYSYPLSLSLSGPVTFLPDGRMRIEQLNVTTPDSIDVNISLIGIGAASMSLGIPEGGVRLDYVSKPVKD
jgi:hypothetical protein